MKILLLTVYYLPSTISCAKLMHDLAVQIKNMGHEAVVVVPDNTLDADHHVEIEDGIDVLRVKSGKIKSAPRFIRAMNEITLSRTIWKNGKGFFKKNSFDLIVYYSPTIFFGEIVKKLRKLFHCSSYLILRDIFPQWALDTGVLDRGIVYGYFKWKEKQNYDVANVIGVMSHSNLDYFRERGLDRKYRLEVLYNWASLQEKNVPKTSYRARLGLFGKVVFFYGGNIGLAQDMDNLIRLADNLRENPNAYILLVGEGSEVARLQEHIAKTGMTNIGIHGPVAQQEYLGMISEFDVGLVSLDRNLRTHNIPGKMLSYMYHSKPILASINPGNDLKDIIEKNNAGSVCINGEDDKLADHARKLITDEKLRYTQGRNARTLLENTFSASNAAQQILSSIGRLS